MSNCDGNYKLNFETSGCCLLIQGSCENGHSFNWTSSDVVHSSFGKKVFSDNLRVSSAIVLSGNSFNKIELLFQFMNLRFISSTSFFAYQQLFICPSIGELYKREQVHTEHASRAIKHFYKGYRSVQIIS